MCRYFSTWRNFAKWNGIWSDVSIKCDWSLSGPPLAFNLRLRRGRQLHTRVRWKWRDAKQVFRSSCARAIVRTRACTYFVASYKIPDKFRATRVQRSTYAVTLITAKCKRRVRWARYFCPAVLPSQFLPGFFFARLPAQISHDNTGNLEDFVFEERETKSRCTNDAYCAYFVFTSADTQTNTTIVRVQSYFRRSPMFANRASLSLQFLLVRKSYVQRLCVRAVREFLKAQ